MLYFTVDPRDSYKVGGSCNTCCCQEASIAPDEINKMTVNYAPWAAPIGGKGLTNSTQFAVEKKSGDEPDDAPNNDNLSLAVERGAILGGDVFSTASSPIGEPLTFGLVPLSGPQHGTITFTDAGIFTYTPDSGYTGYDNFFYTTTDGQNTVIREVIIQVNFPAPAAPFPEQRYTPPIRIDRKRVKVDPNSFQLNLAIEASPALRVGEIYRLTIKQPTLDCDCNEYFHVSCYDFVVGKC